MGSGPVKGAGATYTEVMLNAAEREAALKKDKSAGDDAESKSETAVFAAGCFWGVELAFQRIPGVTATRVGYTGGHVDNPTYKAVCSGSTGHTEALEVTFNPAIVHYRELISVFWERHEPTSLNKQGNDRGTQYRAGVFYTNAEQKAIAEETKEEVQKMIGDGGTVVTEVTEFTKFWPAEDYHQQYLEKGGQTAAKGASESIRCYG